MTFLGDWLQLEGKVEGNEDDGFIELSIFVDFEQLINARLSYINKHVMSFTGVW